MSSPPRSSPGAPAAAGLVNPAPNSSSPSRDSPRQCHEVPPHPDIEMKELKKRNPGEAFEVMRSLSTPDAKVDFPLSLLERKETPMVDIKKKLEAVERETQELRRCSAEPLGWEREHGKEVVQKAIEGNCNFNKMMREKMNQQMEAYHENCNAWLAALLEKSNEKSSDATGDKDQPDSFPSLH
ncbi:unnamed protein product [Pleuronectes platessa]|uniref:Stathmin n=1 Tax=Pleuronectes platessa TaxID=8262 RepID=A0A9N7V9X1_PLEPL|nr:unnamed protein product [Pleuronectes platessa]